ncbi:hypothetical protein [Streptomyces nitrosporeus]|uniref:hypothetical protein n=1 Tax=Streptomyces nitrosporeus TaxID=28894 RepID=UPI0033276CED
MARRGQLSALEAVLTGLRAGGDAARLTAEVDELLRRCGLARGLGELRAPTGAALPYLGPGHPVEEAHVCPAGVCDRVALDGAGTCELFALPLRLVRW